MFIMLNCKYPTLFRQKQAKDPASRSNPVYNCSELTDVTNTTLVPSAEYTKPNKTGIYKVPPPTKDNGKGLSSQECDRVIAQNDIYNDDTDEQTTQDGMVDNELYAAGGTNADNEPHLSDTCAVYINLKSTATGEDRIEFEENDVYESASMSPDQGKFSRGDPKQESVLYMVENDVYSQYSEYQLSN